MKEVLVTGVAGFIGSNLAAALLRAGYSVLGIDDLSAGTRENIPAEVKFYRADVCDQAIYPLFDGIDTVFHLAAKNCLADCLAHPVETSRVNVTGTVNVLEAARRSRVRKFVYADSATEYEGIEEFPSRVDRICPLGTYAVSKRSAALFAESYQRLYGLNLTTVRYFNVYGPGQDWRRVIPPVMSAFILKLLRGERPVIYGSGQKRRDFISVDDVNAFHLLILSDPRTDGRVFNVGSGKNYSMLEIYELIASLLKTGITPVYEPDLPGEAEVTLADISDSVALGWRLRVGIEEGLARMIAHIRAHVLPQVEESSAAKKTVLL